MCDDPNLTPADMRGRTLAAIERYGWLIQYVEAGEGAPAFAYTVGLTGRALPELQVTHLSPRRAHALLSEAARKWAQGALRLGDSLHGQYRLVPHVGPDEAFVARDLYGSTVRLVDLRRIRS
jgi:hypothetical protein